MIDHTLTDRCRTKLIEVAGAKTRITYSDLASHLGIPARGPGGVGPHLDAIYSDEIALGHPDLTVVVVYKATGYGKFNSAGGPLHSVKVEPNNPEHVKAYEAELAKVYRHWAR